MRHLISLVLMNVLAASFSLWADDLSFTLEDLGYSTPVVLRGSHAQVSLPLPRYPGATFTGGTAFLRFGDSDHLKTATILVSVNQIPISEVRGDSVGDEGVVRLSLDRLDDAPTTTLEVTLRGSGPSSWVVLNPDTSFHLPLTPSSSELERFLREGDREIYVELIQSTPEVEEAFLQLAATVGSVYVPWRLSLSMKPIRKRVVIDASGPELVVEGPIARATPAGVSAITAYLNAMFAIQPRAFTQFGVVYAPLAETAASVHGTGELSVEVPIHLEQLGIFPRDLEAAFHFSHGPIGEQGRAILSVHLNGLLVKAFGLNPAGADRWYRVSLPTNRLSMKNVLEMRVSRLGNSSDPMSGALLADSFFSGTGKSDETLANLAGYLWHSAGVTGVRGSQEDLWPAAKILEVLARLRGSSGKVMVLGRGEDDNLLDALFVLGNPESLEALNPPLDLEGGVRIVNPADHHTLLSVDKGRPAAVLQLFRDQRDVPVLTVANIPSGPFSWIEKFSGDSVIKLEGDILIEQGGSWYSVATASKLHAIRPAQWDPATWWSEKKAMVVGVLFLLALALISYVKINLTEQKDLYEG